MANFSYLRMSTSNQDLQKNKDAILRFANDQKLGHIEFVEEIGSGKTSWKERKLKSLFDSMEPGDNLIVSEMSRLGRSLLDVMEFLAQASAKEINIYALKGNWKLDNSLQSQILAFCFSLAASIESELISSRTKESLQVLKSKGVRLGRPRGPGKSKLDQYEPEIIALLKNRSTKRFIADRYGVSEGTLHNFLKKRRIDRFGDRVVT